MIFVRAPLPRLAELLTSLVSDVSTSLWDRALGWRLAREAGLNRARAAWGDFFAVLAVLSLVFTLSVALAWCANRESL